MRTAYRFEALGRWVGEMRSLISHQDYLMLEAAALGELLVARIRLFAAGLIFLMPLLAWWNDAPRVEVVNGAVFATLALCLAMLLLQLARRNAVSVPLRYGSAAFDVTSISFVLALFLLQGYPHTAVNSRVVWELYLISIAATALRGDPRVCMFAGGLAMIQYLAIVLGAASYGDLSSPRFEPFEYGFFSWSDQMTGVGNRAYLDSRLEREVREAHLFGRTLCLAMLDVDHFKRFNDSHGHLSGDAVLREVAARLREQIEPDGLVTRYGGEEFALLFPGVSLAEALQHCQNARKAIAAGRIELPGTNRVVDSPTVSMGLAELAAGQSPEALLDIADRRLNRAKQTGRDRVVASPTPGVA
jgi:diguanylate cyclase (GGDEF)-like protein